MLSNLFWFFRRSPISSHPAAHTATAALYTSLFGICTETMWKSQFKCLFFLFLVWRKPLYVEGNSSTPRSFHIYRRSRKHTYPHALITAYLRHSTWHCVTLVAYVVLDPCTTTSPSTSPHIELPSGFRNDVLRFGCYVRTTWPSMSITMPCLIEARRFAALGFGWRLIGFVATVYFGHKTFSRPCSQHGHFTASDIMLTSNVPLSINIPMWFRVRVTIHAMTDPVTEFRENLAESLT